MRKVRRRGRNGLILDGQLKMRPQIGSGRGREYCHTRTTRPWEASHDLCQGMRPVLWDGTLSDSEVVRGSGVSLVLIRHCAVPVIRSLVAQ
jgi:hypothetical protein